MDSSYADLSGFTMCATQKENDVPAAAVKTGETKTANTVTVVAGGSGALEENPISLDDYMEETFITLNENSAFGRISADENVVVGEMEKSVAEEVHEDIMLTTEDQNGSRSGTGGNDVGDDAQVWQHWTPVLFVDWEVPSNPQCCDTKDEAKCSAPKKSKMEQNRDYHANQRRKKELLQFNIKSLLETDMEYKRLMLEYCKTLQQCDCILPELRTVLFQKANEFYSPEDMMRVPDMNAKPGGRAPRQPFSKERKNHIDLTNTFLLWRYEVSLAVVYAHNQYSTRYDESFIHKNTMTWNGSHQNFTEQYKKIDYH